MHTKIENGVVILGELRSKPLEKEYQEIEAFYQQIDVNVSAEIRRKYEEELFSLRRKIMTNSRLLRRSLRHHMILVKKYKYRPRWWPKRTAVVPGEGIHENDSHMKKIHELAVEIENLYCEIKLLCCHRQYLARALKR